MSSAIRWAGGVRHCPLRQRAGARVPERIYRVADLCRGLSGRLGCGLPLAFGGIAAISAGVAFVSRVPERRARLAFCGLLLITAVLLALRGRSNATISLQFDEDYRRDHRQEARIDLCGSEPGCGGNEGISCNSSNLI